jgi:RelE-like HigB toxin of type II HigAB toxin-antitoxin system
MFGREWHVLPQTARPVGPGSMVFSIASKDKRMVAAFNYRHQMVFTKWCGTHAEFDEIGAKMARMDIKAIRGEADYERALRRVEEVWDSPEGSAESDELEILIGLIEAYEREDWPIDLRDQQKPHSRLGA